MDFTLDIDQIKKNFQFKEAEGNLPKRLRHDHSRKIHILPYATHFDKESITNFNSVIGEFVRLVSNKYPAEEASFDLIFEKMASKTTIIKADDKTNFKIIIKELFFDQINELKVFHPIIYNYLKLKDKEHKKLAEFLFSVFSINQISINTDDESNVLIKLITDSLPELHNSNVKLEKYHSIVPNISDVFCEDFYFVINNKNLFIEDLEKLLKYYYFFYVSQASIKLNKMFEANPETIEHIYFNLDWESISKTRTSYNNGWKLLSGYIKPLFSHAVCLELLNYAKFFDAKTYSYIDLNDLFDSMNHDELFQFQSSIKEFINLYQEYINIDWSNFIPINPNIDHIKNTILIFYKMIDYQFNNSGRTKNYKDYSKWFEEYCKINFLKKRGPLGYNLNLTKEYLIFITKLCMKDLEKIRLKTLFEEYKRRGLFFDHDSEDKIVQFFEKLNLLEKKSDSGDAQYVKSIL